MFIDPNDITFDYCMMFVKRNFPNETDVIQYKMAEAVHLVTNEIFENILPKYLMREKFKILQPSDN